MITLVDGFFRPFAGKFPKISRDYHAFRVFKSSVFQPFSVHNKTQDGVFKLTHFNERGFLKVPFSVDNVSALEGQ